MKQKNKEYVFYIIIALLVIVCVVLLGKLFQKQPAFSPDILSITRPVTILTGNVTEIRGNSILVRQDTDPTLNQPTVAPEDKIIYNVHITKDTVFRDRIENIYALPATLPPPPTLNATDQLDIGYTVQIMVDTDLRLQKSRDIDAKVIYLPPALKYVVGTIQDIKQDGITVKTNEQTLSANLVGVTEYYLNTGTELKNAELKEFKKGDRVVAYTSLPVSSKKKNTVLRVVLLPPESSAPRPTPGYIKVIVP